MFFDIKHCNSVTYLPQPAFPLSCSYIFPTSPRVPVGNFKRGLPENLLAAVIVTAVPVQENRWLHLYKTCLMTATHSGLLRPASVEKLAVSASAPL